MAAMIETYARQTRSAAMWSLARVGPALALLGMYAQAALFEFLFDCGWDSCCAGDVKRYEGMDGAGVLKFDGEVWSMFLVAHAHICWREWRARWVLSGGRVVVIVRGMVRWARHRFG